MPLRKITRQAREAWEVPRDLLLRRYPDFVTGGPLPRGHVPVFVFHSVEPESFGRKLRYLADNGYATLSADEYFQFLMRSGRVPERAVVLTFDDGRGSLWSVGLPLMRRFGMKGIVFLVPGRTPAGAPGPTMDSDDAAAREKALQREATGEAFLTWEEIQMMSHSGLFDFQSHTQRHARIHTAVQVAGFMSPDLSRGYAAMDVPLISDGHADLLAPDVPLGTPLFKSDARTSESLRFFEDPEVRKACVERVQGEGPGFFTRRDWADILRRTMPARVTGRRETPAERESSIRAELADARRTIEERVFKPAVHLCYPWHVAGPTARRLAREAGYRTAFCGKVRGVRITEAGGDPHAIARIGEDYVELLPGRGRIDITSVLREKWTRRFGGK